MNADYGGARKTAQEAGKPLAVVIGHGNGGWNKLSQTGKLTEETLQVLASRYTCLFVNTQDRTGKDLAKVFEIEEGPGIIISDRTGELQAFFHAGDLADATLVDYLRQFADPNLVVRKTITNPSDESGMDQSDFTPNSVS